jgi:hypothetical protein
MNGGSGQEEGAGHFELRFVYFLYILGGWEQENMVLESSLESASM